jgi:aryl-phospho-beta-D-glucosidase BglC (GH1 family)
MFRNDMLHRFARTGLTLLLLVVFCSNAARAEPAAGVNLYLLKEWSNTPPPEAADFDALAKENRQRLDEAAQGGFKLVRILFRMALVTPDAPAAQRETVLRLMTEFVKDANARGIRTVIAPFGDGGTFKKDLICGKSEALAETVQTLASALPDQPTAGLEILNEPPTGCGAHGNDGRWASVQQILYHKLRMARPHLTLIMYGGDWGSLDGILQFNPSPYRTDPNVLFTFHDYEPFVFTRQGAGWASSGYKNINGLPWPYRPEELQEVERKTMQELSGEHIADANKRDDAGPKLTADFDKFRQAGTQNYIASRLGQVAGWARNNGIPNNRVFIGEFGVLRPTHDASGMPRPGAANWIAAMVAAARQQGFMWAVFDLDTSFAVECDQKLCDEYRSVFK